MPQHKTLYHRRWLSAKEIEYESLVRKTRIRCDNLNASWNDNLLWALKLCGNSSHDIKNFLSKTLSFSLFFSHFYVCAFFLPTIPLLILWIQKKEHNINKCCFWSIIGEFLCHIIEIFTYIIYAYINVTKKIDFSMNIPYFILFLHFSCVFAHLSNDYFKYLLI